jgi:hypothetical protein
MKHSNLGGESFGIGAVTLNHFQDSAAVAAAAASWNHYLSYHDFSLEKMIQ